MNTIPFPQRDDCRVPERRFAGGLKAELWEAMEKQLGRFLHRDRRCASRARVERGHLGTEPKG